jgi:hypothetical protein
LLLRNLERTGRQLKQNCRLLTNRRRGAAPFDPLLSDSHQAGPSSVMISAFSKLWSEGCAATAAPPSSFVHLARLRRGARRAAMGDRAVDTSELDQLQGAYKKAVEAWIAAIKKEEALASVNHSVAEIDQWEAAHFKEDALRLKFFDF